MERRVESPEVKQPLKESIDKLQSEQKHLKAIAEALKPLNLTGEALVLIKGDKAVAIPEKAVKQLEELGRMSLRIDFIDVYELKTFGMGGMLNQNVSYVREFVMPERYKVLAVRFGQDITVEKGGKAPSMLDEMLEDEWKYGSRKMVSLVWDIVNRREEKDVELLESYRSRFGEIFANYRTMDEIEDVPWEMVVSTHSVRWTKHYWERVKNTPGLITFDVHIHPRTQDSHPSTLDAWLYAGPKQHIEWAGILHVRPEAVFGEFEFSPNKLNAYYSDPEDAKWLRKAVSELSKTWPHNKFLRGARILFSSAPKEVREFEKKHTAEVVTYKQLVEEAG
jgi:hypothetical protein